MNKKITFYITVLLWTVLITLLFSWNIFTNNNASRNSIKLQGKSFFNQIEISRLWNAQHGGVYVPISEETQPNKFLKTKNREIYIDSLGIKLTKINPAFMTRQISILANEKNGIKFHITSLNPIRPDNKADEWETRTLQHFENGLKDTLELTGQDNEQYYRYMAPLFVKKGCLKCHEKQGYKEGDIRGGISVTIPAEEHIAQINNANNTITIVYILIYLIGLIGIIIYRKESINSYNLLINKNNDLSKAKEKLESLAVLLEEKHEELNIQNEEILAQNENILQQKEIVETEKYKALDASENSRKIFERANDAILIMNDKAVIDCNAKALELFACDKEEIVGTHHSEFSPEYQTGNILSYDLSREHIRQVFKTGSSTFNWIHITKDNKPFETIVSLSFLKNYFGENVILAIVRDITKEKKHQNELKELNVKLEERHEELSMQNEEIITQTENLQKQKEIVEAEKHKALEASKYKSLFLANMSHEIRTPLNGIIGMVEILKESKLLKKQKESLEIIELSGNNLLSIINDILDYSKIEANQLELENITFNLYEEIENVVRMLSLKAETKGLGLSYEIHPDVSKYITGDPLRIRQILINFCNNSIKFTEKGFVHINITPVKNTNDNITLKFEVKDTGIGINKKNQNKLFKEFSQVDSSTSRKFGGTGLGLAISKKLSLMMDGEIGVESELNKGSTFWFTGKYQISKQSSIIRNKDNKTETNRLLNILLVEDNIINQKVATHTIKQNGHSINIANDGLEALELFKKSKYDIILMDIQMPNLNGYETTKEIRRLEKLESLTPTKIIAMTANALKGEKEKCLNIGMNGYLSKPFKKESLINILNS